MVQHKIARALPEQENEPEVKEFFAKWSLYQKAVEKDHLYHREVYRILHDFLVARFRHPFAVLDFGCGDAHFMAQALRGTRVDFYEGADFEPIALRLAEKNMKPVPCRQLFIRDEFFSLARKEHAQADLLWIGLSFHHLSAAQKEEFLGLCKKILGAGGYFLMYEPTLDEGETRPAFLQRWWKSCSEKWTALTPAEREEVRRHVDSADFPESVATLTRWGAKHGFRRVESLFVDPDRLYQLVAFHA